MDALLNCRLICKQRVSRLIGVSCEFVRKTSTEVHRVTMFKSQLLYQLSYAGAPVIVFAESSAACRRNHGRPPALLSKLLSNLKTVVKPDGAKRANCWSFWTPSSPPNRQGRERADPSGHPPPSGIPSFGQA